MPRLHIVTDMTVQSKYNYLQLAEMAWEAAPCVVQYRNKRFSMAHDLRELQSIAHLALKTGNCLVINDSAALAFEMQAQGVHLGEGDGDPADAAKLLGPGAIIGATVHSLAELDALQGAPIHYIGVGPVYGTQSKAIGLPNLGLDGLHAICSASTWPVIAIGGIVEVSQAAEVVAAGAYGVAILSAFCLSEDPKRVAQSFYRQLENL